MVQNQHDGGNDILLSADVDSANGVAAFTVEVQVVAAGDPGVAGAEHGLSLAADAISAYAGTSELVDLRGEIANTHVVELGGAHIATLNASSSVEGNDAPHPTLPLEGGGKGGGDGGDVVALDPDSVLQQASGEVLTVTGDPSQTVALQGTWHLDYKGGGDGFSMYTGTTSDAQHPYVTLFVHTALHVDENGAILI